MPKKAPLTDEERARQLLTELHEAMADSKVVAAEQRKAAGVLREVIRESEAERKRVREQADSLVDALDTAVWTVVGPRLMDMMRKIDESAEAAAAAATEAHKTAADTVATLAGKENFDTLLDQIIEGVAETLREEPGLLAATPILNVLEKINDLQDLAQALQSRELPSWFAREDRS